jgi:FtsH-binding integral membrane protein
MLRLFIPIALIAVFLSWALYHLLIKKDLKHQLSNFYIGIFFMAVWGLIYFLILR